MTFYGTDAVEYYYNSVDFQVLPGATYTNWYERTPAYVLFLHLIQRQLLIQILLSSIAVVLMFKMNKLAGWLWCFYPFDVISSFQYHKECLLVFLIIGLIYLFRERRNWLLLIPLIMIPFGSSPAIVMAKSHTGFINNIWEIWKPMYISDMGLINTVLMFQIPFYVLLMFLFIRKVPIISIEIALCVIFTGIYVFNYAIPRYHEPLIPLIVLFVVSNYKW